MTDAPWHNEPLPLVVRSTSRARLVLAVAATLALAAYTHHRLDELQKALTQPVGSERTTLDEFLGSVQDELDLTAEQRAEIEGIWRHESPSLGLLQDSVSSFESALAEVEGTHPFNEAAAGELVQRKATAAAFLWGKRAYVVSSVLAVLDEEQRAEFRRLRAERSPNFEPGA